MVYSVTSSSQARRQSLIAFIFRDDAPGDCSFAQGVVQTDPSYRATAACDGGSGRHDDKLDNIWDKLSMVGWEKNPVTRRASKASHYFIDGWLLAERRSCVKQKCIENMLANSNAILPLHDFSSFIIYNCRTNYSPYLPVFF
jgi:hypothetical protein